MAQSNDDRTDCNMGASGLAMPEDYLYACIDISHALKGLSSPASSSEHDKLSVMYAVLKGDNERKDIHLSNMEDAPNSSIYQNVSTNQLHIK
ncbi:hypothetical protein XENTR_v10022671 [Xenopus tropicalis]|nr:hypothetical protein XENTR_v10022671 [Xenopus tropicalis]